MLRNLGKRRTAANDLRRDGFGGMKIGALALGFLVSAALITTPAVAGPSNQRSWVPQLPGTPVKAKRMIIRERNEPPRWGYIGPHYKAGYGPGYHTNGPGIGIER